MSDEERRKFKRYRIPEVTGSLLYECQAQVVNVGLSGLAIESPEPLVVERDYQLKISFDEEDLEIGGRVIWCQGAEGREKHRAGLAFHDIWTPEAMQLLKMIQSKVLADLDTRLVRRFQSQKPGSVRLQSNYDFLVKCISLSGMEIEVELQPLIDRRYDVKVNLRDHVFTVRGRIANSRHDSPRINPLCQVGIEFEDLSQEDRKLIEEFIDRELVPKN